MTDSRTAPLPTTAALSAKVRSAMDALGVSVELGEPTAAGLPASTPITGDVLFTLPETTPEQADAAVTEAAQAFTTWRTTPAPVR
ncbi:aldehyde dehydrogenase family protein, partial [Mycolicibacterium pulveris]